MNITSSVSCLMSYCPTKQRKKMLLVFAALLGGVASVVAQTVCAMVST